MRRIFGPLVYVMLFKNAKRERRGGGEWFVSFISFAKGKMGISFNSATMKRHDYYQRLNGVSIIIIFKKIRILGNRKD
jgi:hypothetical protein